MQQVNDGLKREPRRLPLLDQLLREQSQLTAVERFSQYHEREAGHLQSQYYKALLPSAKPKAGQQYSFEVNLDVCSGCKACVTACHRLNGLEPEETWRSVGLLHGSLAEVAKQSAPVQKTVTTACHHCVDPACMNGCPVKAYEKDPVTGIVKHLDDQCIGCQYCVFTCPYEVPQYSAKKGIVRKCDMCTDRLQEGEAPACVQACPNQAIAIRVIDVADARAAANANEFLPGAASPQITIPTTRYVSSAPLPASLVAGDIQTVRPWHAHGPLVVMLVLTQLAAGAFVLLPVLPQGLSPSAASLMRANQALLAIVLTFLALGASTSHLGRPQYAFRAVLGLRTSWLSREIVAFGALSGLGSLYTALLNRERFWALDALLPHALDPLAPYLGGALALVGMAAVFTSVMLYHVTRRSYWQGRRTAFKFFGSAVLLGVAVSVLCAGASALLVGSADVAAALSRAQTLALGLPLLVLLKLYGESRVFAHRGAQPVTDLSRTVMLLDGALRPIWRARIALGVLGGLLALLLAGSVSSPAVFVTVSVFTLIALVGGELCERALFFRAMSSMRMPGGLA